MAAPRTARDRIRAELTHEILATAKVHLARDGAAALSLRSIARDLEMAPSALYRYYSGRDALLSALILDAYGALADVATAASEATYGKAGSRRASDATHWPVVPRAMREWALAHPHEWGLIFGSPVPGYSAPDETVLSYVRLTAALVRPVVDASAAGTLHVAPMGKLPGPGAQWRDALAPVQEGLVPGVPLPVVSRLLQAWSTLVGIISLEVFGHWNRTVLDPALLFEETVRNQARSVGLVGDA
jgi:AcrR family transcriptional regulator